MHVHFFHCLYILELKKKDLNPPKYVHLQQLYRCHLLLSVGCLAHLHSFNIYTFLAEEYYTNQMYNGIIIPKIFIKKHFFSLFCLELKMDFVSNLKKHNLSKLAKVIELWVT